MSLPAPEAEANGGGPDMSFTPGPGLRQNADGTYSRELTKDYMEAAGVLDWDENSSDSGLSTKRDAMGSIVGVVGIVVEPEVVAIGGHLANAVALLAQKAHQGAGVVRHVASGA